LINKERISYKKRVLLPKLVSRLLPSSHNAKHQRGRVQRTRLRYIPRHILLHKTYPGNARLSKLHKKTGIQGIA